MPGLPRELIIAAVLTAGIAVGANALFSHDGGEAHREFRDLPKFDRVAVNGSDDVVIEQGSAFLVSADGSPATVDNLVVNVVNGELRISRRKSDGFARFFDGADEGGSQVKLLVTLPDVRGVSLASSGSVTMNEVRGERLDLALKGSGDIRARDLDVRKLRTDLTGSGDIELSGEAGDAQLSVKGHGDIEAAGLKAKDVTISLQGSGDIKVRSDGKAVISGGGTGDVDVIGQAQCEIAKARPTDVSCG